MNYDNGIYTIKDVIELNDGEDEVVLENNETKEKTVEVMSFSVFLVGEQENKEKEKIEIIARKVTQGEKALWCFDALRHLSFYLFAGDRIRYRYHYDLRGRHGKAGAQEARAVYYERCRDVGIGCLLGSYKLILA